MEHVSEGNLPCWGWASRENLGERYVMIHRSTLALGGEEIKGRKQGEEEHIAQVKKK